VPNPHPGCTSTGTLETSLKLEDGKLVVDHEWNLDHGYTCGIVDLVGKLEDDELVTDEVSTLEGQSVLDTVLGYEEQLTYANFPIVVDSVLTVSGGEKDLTLNSSASIFPECVFDATSISMTHSVKNEGSEGRQNVFVPKIAHSVGPYCPAMKGEIKITKDGEDVTTAEVASLFMSETQPATEQPNIIS